MMKCYSAVVLSVALVAILSCPALAQRVKRPFPATVYDSVNHRSVFVFSDQIRSNLSEQEARFAATHYVGCQKMPREAIRLIRRYNENFLHLHYKLAITVDSIADYGMILNGNWFSDNRSPLSNWGQVSGHADWFLLNGKKEHVVHDGRRIVMDISSAGFRDWWTSSCIKEMTDNECDGVFADTYTVEAIFGRTNYAELFSSSSKVAKDWIPKLNDYGKYVYARLDSAGFYFFPNIDNLQTTWVYDAGAHYYKGDFMHGAMMESWGDWASGEDASNGMTRAVEIQKKGCFVHGEGYFGSNDMNPDLTLAQKRMWLAGTYLLCNNGRMFLSMYGPSELTLGMSGLPLWYPEFEIDLGPYQKEYPAMYQLVWNGVLRRDYEKGFVLVNSGSDQRTVDLGGTFYLAEDDGTTTEYWADQSTGREKVGLKYTAVTSLAMPKFSAAVLLNQVPPKSGCSIEPRGDYNGDGKVDILDAIRMVLDLKAGSTNPCLDFNEDGERGVSDLVAFIIYLIQTA